MVILPPRCQEVNMERGLQSHLLAKCGTPYEAKPTKRHAKPTACNCREFHLSAKG
jgi:hypothetical protein